MTQQELDRCLDRQHSAQVIISADGPLPQGNAAYDPIRTLPQNGFSFTVRELLHAIGCKTAALPITQTDECLKVAWLYTHILDLQGNHLSFRGDYGSDLQTARSQEIGIGMMCLLAERHFGIPWDQLGPLPGQGKRFDYRGTNGQLNCIFECKGTSHKGNQNGQIESGLDKKAAHHTRGENFDIELIIASCISHNNSRPRIMLADPDKTSLKELFERGDNRYYRLKHYCRVLQFVGLPRSAYQLNQYAKQYLDGRLSLYRTIMDEKNERGYLQSIHIEGDEFLGRWFNSWLPAESVRYKKVFDRYHKLISTPANARRSVFQGLRRDIYESGLTHEPFSTPLLRLQDVDRYRGYDHSGASVFPDGTVMIFRQE